MEDKLQIALEYIFDVAEKNNTIIHGQVPECDEEGHSILIQNASGNTGLIYHNPQLPESNVYYYLMDVELYHWAVLEGFSDEDIFESDDFNVLQKVTQSDFSEVICKAEKNKKNRSNSAK
jgi:hypothetical protein